MTHFYFKLTFPLLLLFAAVILLIHLQPYDDSDLRAFLTPKSCAAPCLMGIQLDITSKEQAIQLLRESPWVDQIELNDEASGHIWWSWSQKRSDFINPTAKGELTFGAQNSSRQATVESIQVSTNAPVGYAFLIFGNTSYTDSGPGGLLSDVFVSATYLEHYLNVWAYLQCPVSWYTFWNAPMTIELTDAIRDQTGYSDIFYGCG
jgi:hypothetical protein